MPIALLRSEPRDVYATSRKDNTWTMSDGRELCIETIAGRVVIAVEDGDCKVLESEQVKRDSFYDLNGVQMVCLGGNTVVPNLMSNASMLLTCADIPHIRHITRKKISASLYKTDVELYEGCDVKCYKSRIFGGPVLVYSRTQAGKTQLTCSHICESIKTYNCPGLFVVRPLKGERSSQTAALRKFAAEIDPEIEVVEVNSADDITVFQDLQRAVRVDNKNSKKQLFILMGNHTTLQRATSHLRDNDRLKYLVALDEADVYMKNNGKVDSKAWTRLKPLLDGALEQFYITATPLDVIANLDYREKHRVILGKFALSDHVAGEETYYRSLHSIERRDLPILTNSIDDAIENGQQILQECFQDGLHQQYYDVGLPMFFIHFHSEKVVPNARIAEQMSHELYGDQEVAALTFDNEGGSAGGAKVKVYRKGVVVSHHIDDLSVAITWVIDLGIKVLYFLGGKICSRAFRVTDISYRAYPGVMIYNYNDNCGDGALLDQRMGRMNGVSPLELKCRQYMFCSEQNLNRALDVVDACSEIVSRWPDSEEPSFETVSSEVKRPPRYSRKSLSRSRAETSFTIDPTMTSRHSRENGLTERLIGETTATDETRCYQRENTRLISQLESILNSVGIKQGDMKKYREWRIANGEKSHHRFHALIEERHPGWLKNAATHFRGGVKAAIRSWMQRYGIIPQTKTRK